VELERRPVQPPVVSVKPSVFSPRDVSNNTIKSIETYNDYLLMYQKIIEDYLSNYESAVKGTILYDKDTFADMKRQYAEAFEQQKDMYGSYGNAKLMGKDSLVHVLISYRDSLKSSVDMFRDILK
jgi:hypothetical protein